MLFEFFEKNIISLVKGMCLGNTYFKHMSLHKYTRVARDQYGMEAKRMIDLVLVKKKCCVMFRNGPRSLKSSCTV